MDETRRALLKAAAALPLAMHAGKGLGQTANDPIRRIAVEEAFVTQEIADQWDAILDAGSIGEPGFRKMGETILSDSPGTRLHESLRESIEFMDSTPITELDRHKIYHANAEALFGISPI
jgi:hypothetical protein